MSGCGPSTGHPATLCWVTAGAVDDAVGAWTLATGTTSSVHTLQVLLPPCCRVTETRFYLLPVHPTVHTSLHIGARVCSNFTY